MMAATMRPRRSFHGMAWIGLALLIGILAARVPLTLLGGGLALMVLIVTLVEPALAVVLMLCLAPLKTLIETEAPVYLPVDVGQASFALVVVSWALWRVTQRRGTSLPHTWLYLPLAVIMLAFVPSLFGAFSTLAWTTEFLKWIEIALLVLIVLDLRHRWTWIVSGLVLAAVLQAVIGLYEFRGGSGAPHLWIADYRYFRAFGTFGQPNPFSAFMGLTLPLALGMGWGYLSAAWHHRHNHWRVPSAMAALYAVFALLLLLGLIVSWGRGAWLGFGVAAIVLVGAGPRRRWAGGLLLAAGGGLLLFLWTSGLTPLSIQQRINQTAQEFVGFRDVRGVPISDENFAIIERLAHWQAAIYMANDHPLVGVGLGGYEAAYPIYRLSSWPNALGHAHNDYLNLLAETGVIGLGGYAVGWSLIVVWTVRALRYADPLKRGLVLGLLGTWAHLAVHSFVDKLYVNNLFLHIGVMMGLLAVAQYTVAGKYAFDRHDD